MSKEDGGAAFPHRDWFDEKPDCTGMSLRDWFAGMALQGLVTENRSSFGFEVITKEAYQFADAMIKEREK